MLQKSKIASIELPDVITVNEENDPSPSSSVTTDSVTIKHSWCSNYIKKKTSEEGIGTPEQQTSVAENSKTTSTEKFSLQFTSEQKHKINMERNLQISSFSCAVKEATQEYKALCEERKENPWIKQTKTLESIVLEMNKTHNLTIKKLTKSTVQRYVSKGTVGMSPPRKGPPPKIPDSIYCLVGLHASMMQAADGEAAPHHLQALLKASITDTKYQNTSVQYAWDRTCEKTS